MEDNARLASEPDSLVLVTSRASVKLRRSLVVEMSPKLAALVAAETLWAEDEPRVIPIPDDLADPGDVSVLLAHLSRDTSLSSSSSSSSSSPPSSSPSSSPSLPELCSLVRATSEKHLHFPTLHASAQNQLEEMIPGNGVGALDSAYLDDSEDALGVCMTYHLSTIRKRLLYTVATTSHFEEGPSAHPSLSSSITRLCASIQDNLISHFTPILFTVATASHMACTDVFAETWMPLVISPALESSGLCRPVETLRMIQSIGWEQHGLCADCCMEKRAEWEDEIELVWKKMDDWIS